MDPTTRWRSAVLTAKRENCRTSSSAAPLCESGDIFTQEEGGFVCSRPLPKASVGDYLVIGCTGAYSSVMGSNYNSKPLAAEVLLQDGTTHLIRKRQTFEEMISGEVIPGTECI